MHALTTHPAARKLGRVLLGVAGGAAAFSLVALGVRVLGSQCSLLCQPDVAATLGAAAGLLGAAAAEWDL